MIRRENSFSHFEDVTENGNVMEKYGIYGTSGFIRVLGGTVTSGAGVVQEFIAAAPKAEVVQLPLQRQSVAALEQLEVAGF